LASDLLFHMQMTPPPPPRQSFHSNAQNDRIWRIIIVHLATLRRRSTNDSSLYSQSSRKKVERKGDTLSNTCKAVKTSLCRTQRNTYRTRQHPGQFSNPCRTNFLGLEKRTCPGKRGRLVTLLMQTMLP